MAGLTRLELATFRVTGGRSNQTELQPHKRGINFFMRSFNPTSLLTELRRAQLLVRRSLGVGVSYSPIFMGFKYQFFEELAVPYEACQAGRHG